MWAFFGQKSTFSPLKSHILSIISPKNPHINIFSISCLYNPITHSIFPPLINGFSLNSPYRNQYLVNFHFIRPTFCQLFAMRNLVKLRMHDLAHLVQLLITFRLSSISVRPKKNRMSIPPSFLTLRGQTYGRHHRSFRHQGDGVCHGDGVDVIS